MFYESILDQDSVLHFLRNELISSVSCMGLRIVLSNLSLPEMVEKKLELSFDWNTHDFLVVRQIFGLYEKISSVDIGVDIQHNTFTRFFDDFRHANETNMRLIRDQNSSELSSALRQVAYHMYKILATNFGSQFENVGTLWDLPAKFGPGASTNVKRLTSARRKLDSKPSGTQCLVDYIINEFRDGNGEYEKWLWKKPHTRTSRTSVFLVSKKMSNKRASYTAIPIKESSCRSPRMKDRGQKMAYTFENSRMTVNESQLSFVPKDATVNRSIDIQPTLNSFFQKGLGTWLSESLSLSGNEIKTRQEYHREVVQRLSVDKSAGTIDIQSASNSVSRILVKLLFLEIESFMQNDAAKRNCMELYSRLELLRCPTSTFKDEEGITSRFENPWFSSMGCAFTFELETLIFLSIARSCVRMPQHRHGISVYGDDIIVPNLIFSAVCRRLELLGFRINPKKTFCDEPFRESCGADYLHGTWVRPFYMKDHLTPARLVAFHNFLVRHDLLSNVRAVILEILNLMGPKIFFGPDGFGDGHLIGPPDLWTRRSWTVIQNAVKGLETEHFHTFVKTPVEDSEGLRFADRVFPYYHAEVELPDIKDYLDDRIFNDPYMRASDPFKIRGESERSKVASVRFTGHCIDWEIVSHIGTTIVEKQARLQGLTHLVGMLLNIARKKAF